MVRLGSMRKKTSLGGSDVARIECRSCRTACESDLGSACPNCGSRFDSKPGPGIPDLAPPGEENARRLAGRVGYLDPARRRPFRLDQFLALSIPWVVSDCLAIWERDSDVLFNPLFVLPLGLVGIVLVTLSRKGLRLVIGKLLYVLSIGVPPFLFVWGFLSRLGGR